MRSAALIFLGLLLASGMLASSIVYDNTGLSTSSGLSIGSSPMYDSFSTGSTSGTLTGLILVVETLSLGGSTDVALYADSSTSPGVYIADLGTFTNTTSMGHVAQETVSLSNNPALAANTRYWIGVEVASAGGLEFWTKAPSDSGTGASGEYNYVNGGVEANSLRAPFEMQVTETLSSGVPEPGSFFGGALGALWLLLRHRGRG